MTYFPTQRQRPNTMPQEGPTQTLMRRHTPTRQVAKVLELMHRANSNGKRPRKTMESIIITTKTGEVNNTPTDIKMTPRGGTPSTGPNRTGTMRRTERSPKTTWGMQGASNRPLVPCFLCTSLLEWPLFKSSSHRSPNIWIRNTRLSTWWINQLAWTLLDVQILILSLMAQINTIALMSRLWLTGRARWKELTSKVA